MNGDVIMKVRGKREVLVRSELISSVSKNTSQGYNRYKEYPRYQFMAEIGGFYDSDALRGDRFNMIHGWQLNPYILGGVNVGFRHQSENFSAISLMSDFRFHITQQTVSSYLGLGLGVIYNMREYWALGGSTQKEFRNFFNINIGANAKIYKNIDFISSFGFETDLNTHYKYFSFGVAFKM